MCPVRYPIRYLSQYIYIRRVELVSNRVRCTLGHEYNQMFIISGMCQVSTINDNTLWTVYYYYVSEHQLPLIIDESHTTPITHVNWGPKLLKLISWRYYPCFKWSRIYPRPRAQTPGAEPGCTAKYYSNSNLTLWTVEQ